MGYVPPEPPIRLNLDRFGLPKDYATYMWLVYHRIVEDKSPERLKFLHGTDAEPLDFGQQMVARG